MLGRTRTAQLGLFAAAGALALSLALVPVAFAGKGGGSHKPGGGSGGGSATLQLVVLNSTDGLAHYGGQVTFNVATTSTTSPFVEVLCSQSGTLVEQAQKGFFPAYPWGQIFTLSSGAWTGGAADCTATLYATNGSGTTRTNLTSISFHAYA